MDAKTSRSKSLVRNKIYLVKVSPSFSTSPNTYYKGKTVISFLFVEKPGRHYLKQVVKVNITNNETDGHKKPPDTMYQQDATSPDITKNA